MRFEVLGPVRIRRDGVAVALAGSLRPGLLAMLLANANRPVPVDALVDALWGDAADGSTHKLHLHVHKLRRALDDPHRLSHAAGTYTLRTADGELDAERFTALVAAGENAAGQDPDRAVELLREALGLWRGDPYQGIDLPPLAGEIQRLTELRLTAAEALCAAELERGRPAAVVGELTELVRGHPLRERPYALLMTALARGGRQADALAVYRDGRRVFVDELGLEPGPEMRELERRILAGDLEEAVEASAGTAGSAARITPAELPHSAPTFVGRGAELAELIKAAADADAARLVAITGTAGVGKTALAVRWARQAAGEFPDGQLYVDLRGYGPDRPVPVDEALARLLRGLGVESPAIAADLPERAAQLRTLLAGKRLLMVLDNAVSAEQVRPMLPGSGPSFAVVTSRDSLRGLSVRDGARRIDLDRLSDDEASRLMAELLGDDHPDQALEHIVRCCVGLPLALRIAAERVREHDGELDDLAAELADEHTRLDLFDTGDDPQSSVRSVFSWSYRRLTPEAARLFRLWALHPGSDADAYALDALTGSRDLRATRRHLDDLLRARLADRTGAGRYQVHDLLRAYAAELTRIEDTYAESTAALTRLTAYYVHSAAAAAGTVSPADATVPTVADHGVSRPDLTDYDTALRWLNAERSTLLAVADVAPDVGLHTAPADLSRALWRYLDVYWHLEDALRLHTRALATARRVGDRAGEGWALTGLGQTKYRLHRPRAEDPLQEALAIHEEQGDIRGQAMAENYLAAVAHNSSGIDAAYVHYSRAVELCERLGDGAQAARPLNNLGRILRIAHRYEEAAACLERALRLAERAGHRPSQPHSLRELCLLARDRGRFDEALHYGLRMLRVARENGARRLVGAALSDVATAYGDLGDFERAFDYHRQAWETAERTGVAELKAIELLGLGHTHRAAGDADAAIAAYERVLDHHDEVTWVYPADALRALGEVHAERGDRGHADQCWRRAIEFYDGRQQADADELRRKLESP